VAKLVTSAKVATYPLDEHDYCAVSLDSNGDSERWFAHNHLQGPLDLEYQCSNTDTLPWGPHGSLDRAADNPCRPLKLMPDSLANQHQVALDLLKFNTAPINRRLRRR
jgi:hypothetical protein